MQIASWFQKPVRLPYVSASTVLLVLTVFLIVAVGVSALASGDPDWARWHISYLGESDQISAHFFNVSMWVGSGLVVLFGWQLKKQLDAAKKQNSRFSHLQPGVLFVGLLVIALCVYMVGLFPRSYGVIPHDIFGHTIYFVFLLLSLASPWITPGLTKWFYAASYLLHFTMMVLFALYWTGASDSLYMAEVATFVFFTVWMFMIARNVK